MGLGYAAPYLDRFRPDAERTFAFMPAGQGAVNWPAGGPSATALCLTRNCRWPTRRLIGS
jgi:hypothetical protein